MKSHSRLIALETDTYVNLITTSFEVKRYFLEEIKLEQCKYPFCIKLKQYAHDGWRRKNSIDPLVSHYYQYRYEISDCEGYLLRGTRKLITKILQSKCLHFLHQGHQGIAKCRARAKATI